MSEEDGVTDPLLINTDTVIRVVDDEDDDHEDDDNIFCKSGKFFFSLLLLLLLLFKGGAKFQLLTKRITTIAVIVCTIS